MNFHVLTLFPEMIEQGMQTSILGRAVKNGHIAFHAVNIRDYTEDRHKKVDDYTYGGGAGMLMQAQPVYDAFQAVKEKTGKEKIRLIYLTPQGTLFHQKMAQELAEEEELAFLCGHYEGIDERVLEEIVTDYVSIGDFVLTGGELPAMVMMDAIARLVPGVLNNKTSADFETFHNDLLEYPQYSRPEEWHGKKVPPVLLSGNHSEIEKWRLQRSLERTERRRPDLYEKYVCRQEAVGKMLKRNRRLYMDMIESLRRGRGEILYDRKEGLAVCDSQARTFMLAAFEESAASEIVRSVRLPEGTWQIILHQECLIAPVKEHYHVNDILPVRQAVYTEKTPLPVPENVKIYPLDGSYSKEVTSHYHMTDADYIKERIATGNVYGAFYEGHLAGFAGIHKEGSLGMLEVFEAYRRQGIGTALESFLINLQLSCGYVPYSDVLQDNRISFILQEKLGLYISREVMYWVEAEVQGGNKK